MWYNFIMEDFFNAMNLNTPLAERMRPNSINEFVGQKHIVGEGKLLWRCLKVKRLSSVIFYGPPGVGKTTLAYLIANTLQQKYVKLNAVSSGVSDAKKVIADAKHNFELYGKSTFLILDECHRWSKAQSDSVLEAIEKGYITFIGTTTENPHISMTPAIVSRCRIFKFLPLGENDIKDALIRSLKDKERGLGKFNVNITSDALNHIAFASSSDLRNALNALELAVLTTNPDKNGVITIDKEVAENCIQQKAISVDENMYFDLLSCFCKSIRGSDTEAALYYSQRLIQSGCDPLIICRRLICHCSEDIGMADSNALLLAVSALIAMKNIGLPEGNIPLTHAIIYACETEKSNSVIIALNKAKEDAIKFADDKIPLHLKNYHYDEPNVEYKYPHDFGGYVAQQYMPDSLKDRVYYIPSNNGREKGLKRKKERNK